MTGKTIQTDSAASETLLGVRIIDPVTETDYVADVTVCQDRITGVRQAKGAASGLWLIPGLVDMHVHLRIPGGEKAETLKTGLQAAIAGGVTHLGMMPNTNPPLDSVTDTLEITALGNSLSLAQIHPVPCVTMGRKGFTCTDIHGFIQHGVKAFSDDGSPVESDSAVLEALELLSASRGVLIEHPEVTELAKGGAVNLGKASDATGAEGIPEKAEYQDVERCIALLEQSGSKAGIHFTHLSSPTSIQMVKSASDMGLKVTCDVTPHHIALDEQAVIELGSAAKMNPPLRSAESRSSVVDQISLGYVDAVASDHAPHPSESKCLPIQDAAFGITGLETLLPVTAEVLINQAGMAPLDVIRMLTKTPAEILGIEISGIQEGVQADMVLYDPVRRWQYSSSFSKSKNSPFFGRILVGRVLRVWAGKEVYREGDFV